jgi:hypothetical protein
MFAMNAILKPRAMAAYTAHRRIRAANGFCGSLRQDACQTPPNEVRSVPTRPHVEMTCADYALSEQDLQNDVDFQQARSSSQ